MVARLYQVAGIAASHHRRKGKAGKRGPPVHDDLLARIDERGRVRHQFSATAANQIWLTDVTEHRTAPLGFQQSSQHLLEAVAIGWSEVQQGAEGEFFSRSIRAAVDADRG